MSIALDAFFVRNHEIHIQRSKITKQPVTCSDRPNSNSNGLDCSVLKFIPFTVTDIVTNIACAALNLNATTLDDFQLARSLLSFFGPL